MSPSPQHLKRLLEQGRYEEVFEVLLPNVSDKLSTRKNVLSGWRSYATWLNETGESLLNFDRPEEHYVQWLKQAGASAATLNNRLTQVRRLYSFLLGAKLVEHNPFSAVKGENNIVHEHREVYTGKEVQQLLAHADDEERLLILLATEAGLSNGEVRRLKFSDVLEDGRRLQIWRVRYRQVNFSPLQFVECSAVLQTALSRWLHLNGASPLFETQPSGYLFQFEGKALRDDQLRAKVFALCKKANVAYKPWRALKHLAGIQRLQSQVKRQQVQQDIGIQRLDPLLKLAGVEDGRKTRWKK